MGRIATLAVTTTLALSCQATKLSRQDRLDRAVERLARMAKEQSAAKPGDGALFLIAALLSRDFHTLPSPEILDTPLLAQFACHVAFWGVPGQPKIDAGKPFPEDRLDHALVSQKVFDRDAEGTGPYQGLLREALLNPSTAPNQAIRKRLGTRWALDAEIIAILEARGADLSGVDINEVMKKSSDSMFSYELHGFCLWVARRVRNDPRSAAEWVPHSTGKELYVYDGEVMLAETLRGATGKDFGFDLDKWKKWLGEPRK